MLGDGRDDGVAEGSEPVDALGTDHSPGNPMSHSENLGFKRRREIGSDGEDAIPPISVVWEGGVHRNAATMSGSMGSRRPFSPRSPFQSLVVVVQRRLAIVSGVPQPFPLTPISFRRRRRRASHVPSGSSSFVRLAVAVGHILTARSVSVTPSCLPEDVE